MDQSKKFILIPTCFLSKGTTRSLICDTDRQKYYLIPNLLFDILSNKDISTIESTIDMYCDNKAENIKVILEYFNFLMDNDLILFTDNGYMYSSPELVYEYPGNISNSIIDVNLNSFCNISKFFSQVDDIMCRSLQIRFFCNVTIDQLKQFSVEMEGTVLEWIEYYLPFDDDLDLEILKDICLSNSRLRLMLLYGYAEDTIIWQKPSGGSRITGVIQKIDSNNHCGVVHPAYFSPDLVAMIESKYHNSCLNRKLGIDVDGEIKNCPSQSISFGNLRDTRLINAIEKPGFKKLWDIGKDSIKICKDCEFRYICTDCRAYVEEPDDMLSKPLKCGYNPYTGEWSEWSTNPLKQSAIQYYDMNRLVTERFEKLEVNKF